MNDEEIIKLFEARDERGYPPPGSATESYCAALRGGYSAASRTLRNAKAKRCCAPGTRYLPPDRSACVPIFAG